MIDQPQLPTTEWIAESTTNSQPASVAMIEKREKSTARVRPGTFAASIALTSLGPTHKCARVSAFWPGATLTPGPSARTT